MADVEYVMGPGRQPQSRVAIESFSAEGVVYAPSDARSSETMACANPAQVVASTSWATDAVTRFPGGPVCEPGGGPDDGAAPADVGPVVGGATPTPFGEVVDVGCEEAAAPVAGGVGLDPLAREGEPFNA